MSSENTAFYARLKEVQELQHKREKKRIDLQRKFDNSVTSDSRLSRLRASRLQSYWKKVCENEKKSKARNEQLLRDLERVEAHITTLSSRTQRLKLLKDQYEQKVEEMYPYWKEQMEIRRQSQMKQVHHPPQSNMGFVTTSSQGAAPMAAAQNSLNGNASNGSSQQYSVPSHHQHQGYLVSQPADTAYTQPHQGYPLDHGIPQSHGQSNLYEQPISSAPAGRLPTSAPQNVPMYSREETQAPPLRTASSGYPESISRQPASNGVHAGAGSLPSGNGVQRTAAQTNEQAEDSTTFSISSETLSSPLHQQKQAAGTVGSLQGSNYAPSYFQQELHLQAGSTGPHEVKSKEGMNVSQRQPPPRRSNPAVEQNPKRGSASGTSVAADKGASALTEPFSSSDESEDHLGGKGHQALYSPEVPPTLPKYEDGDVSPHSRVTPREPAPSKTIAATAAAVQPSDSQDTSGSEEDSELDSDISLPLSSSDVRDVGAKQGAESSSLIKAVPRSSESDATPLSLSGFWLLIKAVEAEIDHTDSLEGIYSTLSCTKTIRDEIVRAANDKSGFERLDPRAISMLILEELPLLVSQLQGACLLSERLLLGTNQTITELSIRSRVLSSSLSFWDDILHHMMFLVNRGVMDPEAVARKFAPLLVAADSKAVDKAIDVMSDILLKAEDEDMGDQSSLMATSPGMSPANPAAPSSGYHQMADAERQMDYPSVPPLALGGMEGDTDDLVDTESFRDSKVPLTETDAYQRMMMMSSQPENGRESSQADGGDEDEEDDEDSEDEIEKAAKINPDSPSSQQPKKKRNVLSSLGGSLGMSLDEVDEGGARDAEVPLPSNRTDEVSSPDKSDLGSSLSPTPRGSGGYGYVPSAMEQTQQSLKTTGRSDMNRSAAFWGNESDLDDESEISVPMGTGKVEDDKDDFDFYD